MSQSAAAGSSIFFPLLPSCFILGLVNFITWDTLHNPAEEPLLPGHPK